MKRVHLMTCVMVAMNASVVAWGQILPPVPPAAPATPPYTPPPPPPPAPPAPTPPARPEPQAASAPLTLVERTADGKLKRYETSLEEEALKRMELSAEQRAKVDASLAARRKEIDARVIEKLDAVLEARKTGETIRQVRDIGQLLKIKDAITAIAPEKVMERLMRDGAVTPGMKSRVDQAVREYSAELTAERQVEIGSDIPKIMQLAAGDAFADGTRDMFASLDGMLASAAKDIEKRGDALGLRGESAAAYGELQRAVSRVDAKSAEGLKRRTELTRAFFFEKLEISEQRKLLEGARPE